MEIVMPINYTLKQVHDISLELQIKVRLNVLLCLISLTLVVILISPEFSFSLCCWLYPVFQNQLESLEDVERAFVHVVSLMVQ